MRVLLAVDEMVRSPAVALVRRAFVESGISVATIGPDCRRVVLSGSRPGEIAQVGDDSRHPVYRLDGQLVDCVRVGLCSGFVEPVDVVIVSSGGEVGACGLDRDPAFAAASEAALAGRQAIVLLGLRAGQALADLDGDREYHWCGLVLSELAAWMCVTPTPMPTIVVVRAKVPLFGKGLRLSSAHHAQGAGHGEFVVEAIGLGEGGECAADRLAQWMENTIAAINPRLGVSDGRCHVGCCG